MVLTTSRRDSTGKFANADENREVAEPDECEAIYETSRSAAEAVRRMRLRIQTRLSLTFGTQLQIFCLVLVSLTVRIQLISH
jgi:hypothetical protein